MGVEPHEYLKKLLIMPAQEIIELNLGFGITIDGTVITRSTFEAIRDRGKNGVPLLTGTNLHEGTLYSQSSDENKPHYDKLNQELARDMLLGRDPNQYLEKLRLAYPLASPGKIHEMIWTDMFRSICLKAAEEVSASGPGGWLYRFDLPANRPNFEHLGATHASEMAFTFNTFANPNTHACLHYHDRNDPVVRELANKWSSAVIRFAKTGNPNGEGLPSWSNYRSDRRECLLLDRRVKTAIDVDTKHQKLWEEKN